MRTSKALNVRAQFDLWVPPSTFSNPTNAPELHVTPKLDTYVRADVRTTDRLTGSPVVLASDTGGMSLHLARMLKSHGEAAGAGIKKILEINPKHALIKRLMTLSGGAFDDAAFLLLDQARIVEGEPVADPVGFAKRLSAMLEKALN